jgi:preprotein translocase subunit YajC
MNIFYFLQTKPATQPGSGFGGNIQYIFLGLMILVFWLFFIRPQAKRAKNQKKFITDLQKGDKIVTIAGIHGTINKVNEDGTLNIEVSPGSYIKIEKSAISMDWTAALNKVGTAGAEKK